MKQKARSLGVDLLLVDTGVSVSHVALGTIRATHVVEKYSNSTNIRQDLHDGAGLSDATSPNGLVSNPIF